MRLHPDRPADELRRLILHQPTVPAAALARLCGLTIQQVAGYRAAHTLRASRTADPHNAPRTPTTPHNTANPQVTTRRRSSPAASLHLPLHLKQRVYTAKRRARRSMKRYLTQALRATDLIANTLKDI